MRFLADENVHADITHSLRKDNYEVLSVQDVDLDGQKDRQILEYSEKHGLILISGDKDFGALIEFGTLWGHGKVMLLRYNLINVNRIVRDIVEVIRREVEILREPGSVVIVLSETGYRVHRP
jgi:predicted nuclease of predicted toxin-antitoxin system